ncbi:MAG TPA: MarR family transcriptional regulator [Candidatus Acidoferrales bacterium]|jgi:MarR family 2-MHQ and catechol resistance regulon transcriptional repressor|nr:MarR family transcriptional regulator [Candidatus Acidoferrales bacterium]
MPTHYKGNRQDTAALNAYINLVRASETVLTRAGEDLAAKGVTLAQFGALEALFHLGPMCQHELSEKLLRTGGNVTYVINNLERRGLVKRERMKADQRQIVVRLTSAGLKLMERILPGHVQAIVQEFSRLSLEQQQTLRRLCRTLGRGTGSETEA